MTELPRHPFMKCVQFEVKTGEGRKKSKEKSGEEIKEIQCRESARAEKRERSRSGNLRPGVIFTNVKLNLKELALTGNNKKHKKATWEFYQRKGKGPRSGIYVTTQKTFTEEDCFPAVSLIAPGTWVANSMVWRHMQSPFHCIVVLVPISMFRWKQTSFLLRNFFFNCPQLRTHPSVKQYNTTKSLWIKQAHI